ncbi:MAG: type II toxin-antitoxin system VapC family toxin [Spirochaetota bacterium]
MILVDTSIWIDHLKRTDPKLFELLHEGEVCTHPFIIGELASGNLKNRVEIIQLLKALPEVLVATDDEVLQFIEERHLYGKGLSYIDIHLLASTFINKVSLWTKDKQLSIIYLEINTKKNIF